MVVLRIAFVSTLAAVAACAIASLILFGNVERASFIPLMFALPGLLLLLATAYAALAERGRPVVWRYAALIVIGAIGGGLMLGFVSRGDSKNAAMGSFYGITTALCWIALHAQTQRRARPTVNEFTT
jgi:drug/metabolite transporter (DMT)-like permease